MPGGLTLREGGAVAAVTTVPLPTLNGVWVDELGADRESVAALLDRVAATGLPHCLQMRPGCEQSLSDLAARRGMTRTEDVPLMVLEDASGLGDAVPAAWKSSGSLLRTPTVMQGWRPLALKPPTSTSSSS